LRASSFRLLFDRHLGRGPFHPLRRPGGTGVTRLAIRIDQMSSRVHRTGQEVDAAR